jgi:hypothetical protein
MNATCRLVLDSSIALAWCFADEKNAYADAIAALFPAVEATVPSLWHSTPAAASKETLGLRDRRILGQSERQRLAESASVPCQGVQRRVELLAVLQTA